MQNVRSVLNKMVWVFFFMIEIISIYFDNFEIITTILNIKENIYFKLYKFYISKEIVKLSFVFLILTTKSKPFI
jgi:hypothetical protein